MRGADDERVLADLRDGIDWTCLASAERVWQCTLLYMYWLEMGMALRDDDGRNCRWTWHRMMDKTREEWKR